MAQWNKANLTHGLSGANILLKWPHRRNVVTNISDKFERIPQVWVSLRVLFFQLPTDWWFGLGGSVVHAGFPFTLKEGFKSKSKPPTQG